MAWVGKRAGVCLGGKIGGYISRSWHTHVAGHAISKAAVDPTIPSLSLSLSLLEPNVVVVLSLGPRAEIETLIAFCEWTDDSETSFVKVANKFLARAFRAINSSYQNYGELG